MKKLKLYESAEWLRGKFVREKKTVDEIAAEAGCSTNTIRTRLKALGLIR